MDSTTGKLIQTSGVSIDDSNNVTGIASETVATSIVTGINRENISTDSATTGSNATLATPTTPIVRLTNASLASISMLAAGSQGQVVTIVNLTGTAVTINDETGATAANRFRTGTKSGLSLADTASITVKYDTVGSRWMVIGGSGSGSGSGGINYILTPNAESGIVGWATYADAASTSPVDGTGGSPTSTFTTTSTSPLRGLNSFLFSKPASNRQGDGFSYDFTIDASDKGKVLQCSFEYQIASGTFADNDLSVWIYDVTNASLIQPAPYLIKNSGIIEKFAVEFQTTSNSTSYRLIVHVGSTSASAYTVKLDNFILGPQQKSYGSAITDWTAYTPTVTGLGTGTCTAVGSYRFVGGSMEISVELAFGGTGSGSSQVQFSIPTGYTINGSVDKAGILAVGASFGLTGSNQYNPITAEQFGTNTFAFEKSGTNLFWLGSEIGAGKSIHVKGMFPVNGKSASQVFSSDADTRVVALTATTLPATAITNVNAGTTKLVYSTVVSDTHGGYNSSTGDYTVKVPGKYKITAQDYVSFASGAQIHAIYKNSSSLFYGQYQFNSTGGIQAVSGIADFIAGDVISIRSFQQSGSGTATWGNSNVSDIFLIERISGPAQIAASESVAALYTGAPPTGTLNASLNTVTFGTKVKDSHNAMSSGSYTIPVSGVYSISAEVGINGTRVLGSTDQMNILADATTIASNIQTAYGSLTGTAFPSISIHGYPLLAGQVITVKTTSSASSLSYDSVASRAYFSIVRTGNY